MGNKGKQKAERAQAVMKQTAEINKRLEETSLQKNSESHEKQLLIAKKAFTIFQNAYFREIKVGDDLHDVPERFLANLKTEGVL